MGAGCSSPLRRLGVKKSKPSSRDSISIENNDNLDQLTIAERSKQQGCDKEASTQRQASPGLTKLNFENEITIQSEVGEEHLSSTSFYTNGRNQGEENKSLSVEQQQKQQTDSKQGTQLSGKSSSHGDAAAKVMGLSSGMPHDRHLLVSTALSPAPSVCQSPAPNSLFLDSSVKLDPNDLYEAFNIVTFGLNELNKQKDIQSERSQSELLNQYTHQLIQNQDDLVNCITTVLITIDNSFDNENQSTRALGGSVSNDLNNNLTAHIASRLRSICDEHSYNLRFLNLSYDHLVQTILVNNIQDVALRLFEKEYKDNSDKFIVIILANGTNSISYGSSSEIGTTIIDQNLSSVIPKQNDKRLLPSRIDAKTMQLILSLDTSHVNQEHKDLLQSWYTQIGNAYYLKPIYAKYPDILCESKENAFSKSWKNWLDDSKEMLQCLGNLCDNNQEISAMIQLKSLSSLFIDFIARDGQLQRRTLLIRNYSQSNSMVSSQQQISTTQPAVVNKVSLSELARHLPDSNKLTIKKSLNEQELIKTIDDWTTENINKFADCFHENRIVFGKFPPPFMVKNLFVELTRQRHQLEYYLNNITAGYEAKCQNFYNSQIRPLVAKFIDGTTNCSDSNVEPLSAASCTASNLDGSHQSLSSQLSANHLVLISGPKGCGKTTLLAQIIKYTAQELIGKALIIYRFCGFTRGTLSPDRLLMSICEQFCQIQGENTAAASYIYSARRDIMNSLNKIIKQQDCLIFLDGLESFDQHDETSLDWLCELEASDHIKIFMMLETNSRLYKRALEMYTDATYISLDNPTTSEWAQMLTQTARAKRLNSVSNLYDEAKNLGSNDPGNDLTITYHDVSDALGMCEIRRLNNEYSYPELFSSKSNQTSFKISDFKNIIHQGVLKHLHYLLAPYQLCSFLLAIDCSRNGLCENDIIEIMDILISRLQHKYPDSMNLKFSSSLLSYLTIHLNPWLRYIVCDKVVKLTLQKDFLSKAIEYYLQGRYSKLVNDVHEVLLEYFGRPIKQSRQKSSKCLDLSSKINVSRAEAIWLETHVSETMNLLLLTNPTKAKEYIMNKDNFYLQFFHRSDPEQFLEDYDRLKLIPTRKASQTNEELSYLVNSIKQSIFPLRYDGTQIYSQIYCRTFETNKSSAKSRSKRLNEIISQASCPPIINLLPVSETSINSFIKTRIGLNEPPATTISSISITSAQSSETTQQKSVTPSLPQQAQKQPPFQMQQQHQFRQKITTIKDNHRHVIVTYPDKNCLAVWDIFEERAVRMINNVDQPRDLRMIDQKRAVVLCNRELRVYDLDSGQLLTKLKGVMNQKMPYFEVFGQDYVIALARNRMYVNMLNLNTGELETTFKVGEDRFLNSLLVSANGGICVCGDETQKPFPLLVWNLNERRLMYDLRLERHEFVTRMSAISDDGHFVVSVCKQLGGGAPESNSNLNTPPVSSSWIGNKSSSPNFIVIYDLSSGTLFKKWKPGLDTCGVAISLSANRSGRVINTIVDSSILVWDLATGSKRHTLIGHSAPADVITVQNNRLFSMDSTCRDQSLRIWDIEEGHCLAVFSPDAPVSCCQLSTRGDALVCGFASETRLSTLVMCKNETTNDIVKRNKRRKSSKSLYVFDESPTN